jgi:hypothetical protein
LAVDLDGILIGWSMGGGGSTSTVENGKETPQSTAAGFLGVQYKDATNVDTSISDTVGAWTCI